MMTQRKKKQKKMHKIILRKKRKAQRLSRLLLKYVQANKCHLITRIIKQNPNILNHAYKKFKNRPILTIACSDFIDKIEAKTVEILLENGADVNYSTPVVDEQFTALHFATRHCRHDLMLTILQKHPQQINVKIKKDSLLHTLIKDCEKVDEVKMGECVKVLLRFGIAVNCLDNAQMPPIEWLAYREYKHVLKILLESSREIDIDTKHTHYSKTARELIEENKLYQGKLPPKIVQKPTDKDLLFKYLEEKDEEGFINFNNGYINNLVNADDSLTTLLQKSCMCGLEDVAHYLLEKGADPFKATEKTPNAPLNIVAERGYFTTFQTLINKYISLTKPLPKTTLISIIRHIDHKTKPKVDFEECFNILLAALKKNRWLLDVNYIPKSRLCAIHYATRYASEQQIRQLLNLGTTLAVRNDFNVLPVQYIDVDVLEKHLDDCVSGEFLNESKNNEMRITFNIETLLPPTNNEEEEDEEDKSLHRIYETDVVLFISSSEIYQRLLKHPVIVSLLFLKWHRIYWLFFVNIALYFLFILSLGFHIFFINDKFLCETRHNYMETWRPVSYCLLWISLVVLVLREVGQMYLIREAYWRYLENYIELLLLICTTCILVIPDTDVCKELSSICILLAAFELISIFGKHPKLATYIAMLRKVSINFFIMFGWYFILVFAFALSFHMLFTTSNSENSFSDTMFTTLVLLIGIVDIEPFEKSIIGRILFCMYIFIVTIILMNLLNGLAVSDTQLIKNEAEIFGHKARTKYVSHVERLLLSDSLLPDFLVKTLRAFCCLPLGFNSHNLENYLQKYEIQMNTVDGLINLPGNRTRQWFRNSYWFKKFWNLYLDEESVKRAWGIVMEKRDRRKSDKEEFCKHCSKIVEKLLYRGDSL